ncbi:hypothetical protein GCM10017778_58080 [Streptomyces vinaceus]|nr:hypothetical protein GCM10017778_58080 [Streptomyces vinaceus]
MAGLPSRQLVNTAGGRVQARSVAPGHTLWALDGDRTVKTAVVWVTAVKARDVVDVVTDRLTITVAPDQLLDGAEGEPVRVEPHRGDGPASPSGAGYPAVRLPPA